MADHELLIRIASELESLVSLIEELNERDRRRSMTARIELGAVAQEQLRRFIRLLFEEIAALMTMPARISKLRSWIQTLLDLA